MQNKTHGNKPFHKTPSDMANRCKMYLMCCGVLQCVAMCCNVLRCVAMCCDVLQCVAVCCNVLQCVAMCCSVLQCVAVCCNVLQCVALCCSVLSRIYSPYLYETSSAQTQNKFTQTHRNKSLHKAHNKHTIYPVRVYQRCFVDTYVYRFTSQTKLTARSLSTKHRNPHIGRS